VLKVSQRYLQNNVQIHQKGIVCRRMSISKAPAWARAISIVWLCRGMIRTGPHRGHRANYCIVYI
jgi:hypothetical protein